MNPKPIPFVIDHVNGITMIVSVAERPSARSPKSIPARCNVPWVVQKSALARLGG